MITPIDVPYAPTTYTTTTVSPVYTTTSTQSVPFPTPNDYVEFGKAFDLSILALSNENMVQSAYSLAIKDFFRAKAEHFPTWEGLPTIKVNPDVDLLRKLITVGWYVQVPPAYVISADDKLEEDLWQS